MSPLVETDGEERSAIVSACGAYRYTLGRRWAPGGRTLAIIMMNPSTADADEDDATIRKCRRVAKHNGYSAIEVVNLFAYRATDPKKLRAAGFPIGEQNDAIIMHTAGLADAVCVAWGALAAGLRRPDDVMAMLQQLRRPVPILCMATTRSGYPQHPLFLPGSTELQEYNHVRRT